MAVNKLATAPLMEVLSEQKFIYTAQTFESLQNVLTRLIEHRLQALPVLKEGKCVGFVDSLDLIAYIFNTLEKENRSVAPQTLQQFMDGTLKLDPDLLKVANVKDAIKASHRRDFIHIDAEKDVNCTWHALVAFARGLHRVAIMRSGSLSNVLTQSTVLQYLHKHKKEIMGDVALKTPQELGHKYCKVEAIKLTTPLNIAFHKMHRLYLSSLGVEDANGKIVDNLSAGDLRYFLGDWHALVRPFSDCREQLHSARGRSDLVCIKEDATFGEIVDILNENRLHRVYVRNADGKCVGLITISDVCKILVQVDWIQEALTEISVEVDDRVTEGQKNLWT